MMTVFLLHLELTAMGEAYGTLGLCSSLTYRQAITYWGYIYIFICNSISISAAFAVQFDTKQKTLKWQNI